MLCMYVTVKIDRDKIKWSTEIPMQATNGYGDYIALELRFFGIKPSISQSVAQISNNHMLSKVD